MGTAPSGTAGVPGVATRDRGRRHVAPLAGALAAVLTMTPLLAVPSAAAAEPEEYLVSVDGDAADFRSAVTSAGGVVEDVFGRLDMLAVTMPPAAAEALDRLPDLEVVPNFPLYALDTRTDPPSYGQDRIDQRALPLSSSYSTPATGLGAGVDVYVFDTGIRADHAQFGGRVAAGFGAVADGRGTADCNGHGTHVAGTVAGSTVGIAPAAALIPVRILDCTGNTSSGFEFMEGMDWVLAHHQAGKPAVLNMSIGATASSFIDSAVAEAVADGIVVVAAAGNSAANACSSSPARAASAITVAATSITDARASYSNYGSCVDLFAPGGDRGSGILSAYSTSSTAYANLMGTSMASPHVAGVAARYLSEFPTATPAQVASALVASATPGVVSSAGAGSPNRLLYADPAGFRPAAEQSPQAPAESPAPAALTSSAPRITGTATVGQTLTASPGTWGPSPVVLKYQWKRAGTPIAGAADPTYRLTSLDAGRALTVTVTGAKQGYQPASKTSKPVVPLRAFAPKPTPRLHGPAIVGSTMSVRAGSWGNSKITLRYQWKRAGDPIRGATSARYTVGRADTGKLITVTVTGTMASYAPLAKTSAGRTVRPR
jgi:subtilisin family serine protease